MSPDTHKPVGRIYLGQDITPYVMGLAYDASKLSTFDKNFESQKDKKFDVKAVYPGHEGKSYHGFLFNGKYISLRDAGNILAGINAHTHGERFDDYMKGAGAYNVAQRRGVIMHELTGKTYGPPPYYGEDEYTGSRVAHGYGLNTGLTHTPPPEPEIGFPQP